MTIKHIVTHEAIAAFYLSMFSILAPLTHTSSQSTMVLFGALIVCFVLNLYLATIKKRKGNLKFLFSISLLILSLLLIDNALRPNFYQIEAAYGFLLYGFLTIYFLSFISDYGLFLKSYLLFAIFSGFLHSLDPLTGYAWSENYMEFGFVTMLPAFVASSIAVFYFKYKIALLPLCLFFVELLICANKGSLLTAVIILFISIIYLNNNLKLNKRTVVNLLLFSFALFLTLRHIFALAIELAENLGINSYSLVTLQTIIDHGSVVGSSADSRSPIWSRAWEMYKSSPIVGNGVGYFYIHDEGYEHNIFLEILNSWGILGMLILLMGLLKSIFCFSKTKDNHQKLLILVFFIMSFVPLMISLTFWKYQYFWAFWGICFSRKLRRV